MARYYQFRPSATSDTSDADTKNPAAGSSTWYGEYSELFACRLFAVHAGRVAVAPYDIAFIEAQGMQDPPLGEEIRNIAFSEFETLWEELAQPRLDTLAHMEATPIPDVQVLYVWSPFPASFKNNELSSDLYTEWANGIARRHFEVFPEYVVVATHDPEAAWPDQYEAELEAIERGTHGGNPIDPSLCPIRLSHAKFEEIWERYALKRLHALAGMPRS